MRKTRAFGGVIGAAITAILLIIAIMEDREQQRLIDAGACTAKAEAWYQPPPTSYCSMRSDEGACLMWRQYQSDPYLRTYWVCSGGKSFWRRSVHG